MCIRDRICVNTFDDVYQLATVNEKPTLLFQNERGWRRVAAASIDIATLIRNPIPTTNSINHNMLNSSMEER